MNLPEVSGASGFSSLVALLKTILGAGLLLIPLAFATDGILFGVFFIVLAAITSGFGLIIQARVAEFVPRGSASFFAVSQLTYPSLSIVFDLAIAIQCFGCAVSYLILIGDIMPKLLPHALGISSDWIRPFWISVSAFFCVPLSFKRNLDSLQPTLIIGLSALLYIAGLVLGHCLAGDLASNPDVVRGNVVWSPSTIGGIARTFPIMIFAFTGHQNMFSIINEAKDHRIKSLDKLICMGITSASVFFIVVGLAGYLTFGDAVYENVVMLYPVTGKVGVLAIIARYAIVFVVVTSFPLMLHPARMSVNNIYHTVTSPRKPGAATNIPTQESPLLNNAVTVHDPVVPFPDRPFRAITTLLLVAAYALAMSVTSFAIVLAVVGATGSTAISFILPGLFGYKLLAPTNGTSYKYMQRASVALIVWGFAVMVLCLYETLK